MPTESKEPSLCAETSALVSPNKQLFPLFLLLGICQSDEGYGCFLFPVGPIVLLSAYTGVWGKGIHSCTYTLRFGPEVI